MDRRIDERLRKPRRTKGTPFYIQRNYWAAGVIIAGGLSWFLLDSSKNPVSDVEEPKFIIKKSTQAEQIISFEIYEYSENSRDFLTSSESPYKNLIKGNPKIKLNDSDSDISDFRSPAPIRKPVKNNSKLNLGKAPAKKNVRSKNTLAKKSHSSKSSIEVSSSESTAKIIQDNFKYFGDNPEHIQMAIALSRSSYEHEYSSRGQPLPKEEEPDIGGLLRNSKPSLLEKFGFSSKQISDRKKKVTTASTETNQKIRHRFKYITPILDIRTNKERKELIRSKISLILSQKCDEIEKSADHSINSNTLNKYIAKEKSIFKSDRIYDENNFYVNCLEIPETTYKCGCLLKDWKSIPGRDVSPTRTTNLNLKEEENNEIGVLVTELSPGRNCAINKEDIKEFPAKNTFDKTTKLSVSKETSDGKYVLESSDNRISPRANSSFKLSPSRNCTIDTADSKEIPDQNTCDAILSSRASETTVSKYFLKCSSNRVSPKASCSFDSDKIKESKSSNPTFENITTRDSVTSSSISRISAMSPCRSISPDLFASDDESFQQSSDSNNCLTHSLFPSKMSVETNEEYSHLSNCSTSQKNHEYVEKKYDKNNDLSKNCQEMEILVPHAFVDLTDDDETVNKSLINSLIPTERIAVRSDSPDRFINKNKESKRKKDIYSLEEFEENDKKELSDNEEYVENIFQNDDVIQELNRQTDNICESKNNSSSVITTIAEKFNPTLNIADEGCSSDDVTSDHTFIENMVDISKHSIECSVINIDSNLDTVFNTINPKIIDESISSNSKTDALNDSVSDSNFHKINDSGTHINEMNVQMELKENGSEITGPSPTPVDNSPVCHQSLYTKNNSICSNTSIKCGPDNTIVEDLSLEETPKKYMRNKDLDSPYFDEPILYNSRDLNVTDYVINMLSQDNCSSNATDLKKVNTSENMDDPGIDNEDIPSSQSSQSMDVLDEELNYSSHFCTPLKPPNFKETKSNDGVKSVKELTESPLSRSDHFSSRKELVYPEETVQQSVVEDNFIIKTKNVTPMPNYDKMATPQINKELMKVGVKPLKRTRGAKLLKYIYESTHPVLDENEMSIPDNLEEDEDKRIIKRKKRSNENLDNLEYNYEKLATEIIGDRITENEQLEDLIFERRFSVKISSCKVPLQIAWYNLVNANPNIKESILLYEPLQLESLHVMLKEQGFKFHIQDLLTFLDKKCITIRMAQKQNK